LSVGFKPADMESLMKTYSPKPVIKAHKLALRDTAKNARTQLSKDVRVRFDVAAATVKSKSFLVGDNGNSGTVKLIFRDFRPNLGRFDKGQGSNGRKVRVLKASRGRTLKGSFKINKPKLDHLIFARLTKGEKSSSKYAGRKSGLKVLRTIAVPEMVGAVANNGRLDALIQSQYVKRFNHHFMRAIGLRS
jgi:hypothetical protein